MDELSDVWNVRKNPYDYALYFEQDWKPTIQKIVAKDYNHPSDPSETAIIFTLKTRGKKRGYVERQEVTGADGLCHNHCQNNHSDCFLHHCQDRMLL